MNERARRMEKRLQWPMLIAAVLVVPAIAIEQSEAGGTLHTVAVVINWATWLAFLAEALLMLSVVDNRWQWIRDHPLEVAIVVVTPPFLPASLEAARVFRLFRLLPLLRAGMLARRLLTTEGVRDVAVFALVTVLGGGAAYSAVETSQHLSTWDGVWWAFVTVTTVGYGDTYPMTQAGRAIAVIVMLVGIQNTLRRVLAPTLVAASTDEGDVTWAAFHTFRHTFATLLVDAGANVKRVSKMLGHHKASFTLDYYTHLFDDDQGPTVNVGALLAEHRGGRSGAGCAPGATGNEREAAMAESAN